MYSEKETVLKYSMQVLVSMPFWIIVCVYVCVLHVSGFHLGGGGGGGGGGSFPPSSLASPPKRLTVSLHHRLDTA